MIANIFDLGKDCLGLIFDKLDAKSVLNFCSTCVKFRNLKKNDIFWRNLYQRDFDVNIKKNPYKNYKKEFKEQIEELKRRIEQQQKEYGLLRDYKYIIKNEYDYKIIKKYNYEMKYKNYYENSLK